VKEPVNKQEGDCFDDSEWLDEWGRALATPSKSSAGSEFLHN